MALSGEFQKYNNKGLTIVESSLEPPINSAYKWTVRTYDIGNVFAQHMYVVEEHWTAKPTIKSQLYRPEEDGATYMAKFPLEGSFVNEWHQNGLIHRDGDRPAFFAQIYKTRTTLKQDQKCKGCFVGFQLERTTRGCDGAYVQTFEYYKEGRKHRRGGPAVQVLEYNATQGCLKLQRQEFWLYGVEVTQDSASSMIEFPFPEPNYGPETLSSGRWIPLGEKPSKK